MRQYIQRYLKNPNLLLADRRNEVALSHSCNPRGCRFEGKNKVYPGALVCGSSLGRGTYVGPDSRLIKCKVGRYCSIGPELLVIAGKHPVDEKLSTHPCFYSTMQQGGFSYVDKQHFEEFNFVDREKKFFVEIGSDVWIGARVVILGGVRIGHGAVIATGSVVNKDVEDFSIVGGVPSKHIRHRFDEGQRKAILQDPWWEKDEAWIQANLNLFTGEGVI